MMFLVPTGGLLGSCFGILTSPGHRGIPAGIKSGMIWAADNQAYTKGFMGNEYFEWLDRATEYRDTCLFVACPDVVGNARKTLELFEKWHNRFEGWPVAFVAQDGQENLEFPPSDQWQALFIGGSTIWKMSDGAIECIRRAQKLGKHIHIGRVNYMRRYQHFASLDGSEGFTCDGTRIRFGRDKAIDDWKKYMVSPKQYGLFVSGGDSAG